MPVLSKSSRSNLQKALAPCSGVGVLLLSHSSCNGAGAYQATRPTSEAGPAFVAAFEGRRAPKGHASLAEAARAGPAAEPLEAQASRASSGLAEALAPGLAAAGATLAGAAAARRSRRARGPQQAPARGDATKRHLFGDMEKMNPFYEEPAVQTQKKYQAKIDEINALEDNSQQPCNKCNKQQLFNNKHKHNK